MLKLNECALTSSDLHLPLRYYQELLISRIISLQHFEALSIEHLWLNMGWNWLEHLRTSADSKTQQVNCELTTG